MITDTIAILAVFSVPLAAIFGAVYLKAQRLKLQAGAAADPRLGARLASLEADNAEMRARIETLETIVTSDDVRPRVRVTPSRAVADEVDAAASSPSAQREQRR